MKKKHILSTTSCILFLSLNFLLFISCDSKPNNLEKEPEVSIVEKSGIIGNYEFIEKEYYKDKLITTDTVIVRIEFPERVTSYNSTGYSGGPNNGTYISIFNYENKNNNWEIFGEIKGNVVFMNGKSDTSEKLSGTIKISDSLISDFNIAKRKMFRKDLLFDDTLEKHDDKKYPVKTSKGITVKRVGVLKRIK
ncbi:hypothetical protein [Aureivirga sp. CE67]|uniref:hypothetical protein n=1 Tax=Aureivirga sp. CE67 TaxID=1788983 RepID=UPI0018CA1BD6|nr:hypothetical protein [Aureivirga sp. CE67]